MKDLNLPIIVRLSSEPRILSMDEYQEFVEFNLRHCFDRKAYEEEKKRLVVNVPFVL
ncbi:MAG: hypothetical protein HQL23_06840 [Candidatus Omnitrophica bacterium]|nr:hypothetical protein [Candidatus Omnitrophota bacterium]